MEINTDTFLLCFALNFPFRITTISILMHLYLYDRKLYPSTYQSIIVSSCIILWNTKFQWSVSLQRRGHLLCIAITCKVRQSWDLPCLTFLKQSFIPQNVDFTAAQVISVKTFHLTLRKTEKNKEAQTLRSLEAFCPIDILKDIYIC